MDDFDNKIRDLDNEIEQLTAYMKIKIRNKDWHGVADAAMDIRELSAKIEVYEELKDA